MSTKTTTALDRAIAAGRELVAEGEKATGAAIRTRAGVAMATAVEAARAIRHEQESQEVEPEQSETPAVVMAAAGQVWKAAVEAARDELAMDRQAWMKQVRDAQAERDEMGEELSDASTEIDRLSGEVETLTKRLTEAEAHNARLVAALQEQQKPAPAKRTTKATEAAK